MFIIPYGQERNSVRLLPWVTIIIIIVNIFVHVNVSSKQKKLSKDMMKMAIKVLTYWKNRSYLDIKKMWSDDQINYESSKNIEKIIDSLRERFRNEEPEESIIIEEQKVLDNLIYQFNEIKQNVPWIKYGFIPLKKNIKSSFTYMFIHGGWLHLIFNLLLLWVVGPYIEDVWGKTMYTLAYLGTGILSAFAFATHYPDMAGPLIGASGAISGILGAFLIRFWNAKIKFFYWFWFIIGTFRAPAWLMIPLWFANELFTAKQMDSIYKHGSGVAHWAHVWGFVFGVLIAIGLKFFNFEKNIINKKFEEKYSFTNRGYIDYEEASKLKEAGKTEEAFNLLLESANRDIKNTDVVEMLWVLGTELNRLDEIKTLFLRHIEYELKTDRVEAAHFHYNKIIERYPDIEINKQLRLVLIKYLIDIDAKTEAINHASLLYEKTKSETLPGFLIPFSEILLKLDTPFSKSVIERTINTPDVPEFKKEELKKGLSEYMRGEKKDKKIGIIRAIPIGLNKHNIIIKIQNKGKTTLPLSRILFMSTIKIVSEKQKGIFLIDLFLDDIKSDSGNIKVIRIYSVDFNPLNFIPKAENIAIAFKTFINVLLKYSGAKPFFNLDYLLLKKVKSFSSIKEYDDFLKE